MVHTVVLELTYFSCKQFLSLSPSLPPSPPPSPTTTAKRPPPLWHHPHSLGFEPSWQENHAVMARQRPISLLANNATLSIPRLM